MRTTSAPDQEIERDGISSDSTYKIVFNSKMAKILSDGLYSDKIKSIIRELSSNAYDSHIAAKNQDPFEVHLPNTFEPYFYVRDFGTGLDYDEVMSVYTVYGASTKTESNDYVGQLGLGSKSPFSYVDAFDVTAIKDGIERQFSMYKNEKGMPSVALLGEKPTKEHNGVTVKMPVLVHDSHNFIEKAASVYQWYDVKPKIVGAVAPVMKSPQVAFEGKNWKILSPSHTSRSVISPHALMGRVAYPINSTSINNLTPTERVFLEMPVILSFEIGDLEVSASRESLGYDSRTQDNIRAHISQAIKELGTDFEKKMSLCKTEWEARETFDTIFNSHYGLNHGLRRLFGTNGLKWKNNIVITSPNITVNPTDLWDSKNYTSPIMYTLSPGQKRCRQITSYSSFTLTCNKNTVFVIDDIDKGVLSRVHYYNETNNYTKRIFVIGPNTIKSPAEISKMLGNPPTIKASTLPKRPVTTVRKKVSMLQYDETQIKSNRRSWFAVDIDINAGGVYVDLDHWDIIKDGYKIHSFNEIFRLARKTNMIDSKVNIYAPRGKLKSVLENDPKWVTFWDHVKKNITKKATPELIQSYVDHVEYSGATNTSYRCDLKWEKIKGSVMVEYSEAVSKMKQLASKNSASVDFFTLANQLGVGVSLNVKPTIMFKDLTKKMIETYPMLRYVFDGYYHYRSTDAGINNQLIEYVKIIDQHNANKP